MPDRKNEEKEGRWRKRKEGEKNRKDKKGGVRGTEHCALNPPTRDSSESIFAIVFRLLHPANQDGRWIGLAGRRSRGGAECRGAVVGLSVGDHGGLSADLGGFAALPKSLAPAATAAGTRR